MAANHVLRLLLLLVLLFNLNLEALTPEPSSNAVPSSISGKSSVIITKTLCIKCLLKHANTIGHNERRLTQTALLVSLARARSATVFAAKSSKARGIKRRQYVAIKDCMETLSDSVDRLGESVREMGRMRGTVGRDFLWHMSNVQTWVSAALTDENTCLDGSGGRDMNRVVKAAIRRRVANVAQVTNNALALVNHFASKHRTHGQSP